MCRGENNADHAAHYINAQLGALYENAIQCTQRHESSSLKAYDRVRYDFALAEFFYASKHRSSVAAVEDMLFSAEFDRPNLEFICNHEAVIHFRIHHGHMNLDFAKAAHPGFVPSRDRNVPLDDVDVSFRVRFVVSGIQGHTKKIGNGVHVIKLMVLDTLKPRFVATSEPHPHAREALTFYLTKYLEYLREAGYHVFYSLPDWDNDGEPQSMEIDFSAICDVRHLDFEGVDFCGISIETINTHLSKVWLEAAMIVETEDTHIDYHDVCLAEYRSTWTDLVDLTEQFCIRFDAPRVRVLCDSEAVLYFKISELAFFATDDFTKEALHVFRNWEIAFFVDIIYERNAEGVIVNIKFDFNTRRFIEHLCIYGEHDVDRFEEYHDILIHFIDHYYFKVLLEASRHIIYTQSTTVVIKSGWEDHDHGVWGEIDLRKHRESITIINEERVTKTHMFGFDYIQAITQTSITEYFESLWRQSQASKTLEYLACLVKWSYEKNFEASFGAIQIRLLSHEKAIILVSLQEGTMIPLRGGVPYTAGGSHGFDKWVLAFEVDIKLVEHEDLIEHCGSWVTRFKDSPAGKLHGQHGHIHLSHIILDLTTAEFIHGLSHFGGMYLGNRHAIALVQSAIHYVKHHYFQVLTLHGHHILYTIPVWGSRLDMPAFGLTSVKFHVYSKIKYTREHVASLREPFQPVIMIIGMCEFREWPAESLEYSAEWISWTIIRDQPSLSYGMVCIARRIFFEERLLSILAKVNQSTTIIPTFSGVEGGEWILQVATWAEHERKRHSNCDWQLVKESADVLEYKWDQGDEWSYEHHGMSEDSKNGIYWVHSHTRNDLSIPTAFKHGGFEIKVKGNVTLEIGFKKPGKEWSTKAVAHWSTVVAFVTEGSGLAVKVWGETRPIINSTHVHSELINTRFTALQKLLETHLPSKIDLVELSEELQTSFCGDWKFCYPGLAAYGLVNPVFNRHGDIMFDIRPHGFSLARPTIAGRPAGLPSSPRSRPMSRVPSTSYGPKSPSPSSPTIRPLNNTRNVPVDLTNRPPPRIGLAGAGEDITTVPPTRNVPVDLTNRPPPRIGLAGAGEDTTAVPPTRNIPVDLTNRPPPRIGLAGAGEDFTQKKNTSAAPPASTGNGAHAVNGNGASVANGNGAAPAVTGNGAAPAAAGNGTAPSKEDAPMVKPPIVPAPTPMAGNTAPGDLEEI